MPAETDSLIYTIGLFTLDMGKVRVSDLKSMRKFLPRIEYNLLKNRKCARMRRSQRKKQTWNLIEIN